jgi:hypothetical protein
MQLVVVALLDKLPFLCRLLARVELWTTYRMHVNAILVMASHWCSSAQLAVRR